MEAKRIKEVNVKSVVMDPDSIGKDVKAYTLSNMTYADRGFGSLPSDEVPSIFVVN
jgi:hypothetical protein